MGHGCWGEQHPAPPRCLPGHSTRWDTTPRTRPRAHIPHTRPCSSPRHEEGPRPGPNASTHRARPEGRGEGAQLLQGFSKGFSESSPRCPRDCGRAPPARGGGSLRLWDDEVRLGQPSPYGEPRPRFCRVTHCQRASRGPRRALRGKRLFRASPCLKIARSAHSYTQQAARTLRDCSALFSGTKATTIKCFRWGT